MKLEPRAHMHINAAVFLTELAAIMLPPTTQRRLLRTIIITIYGDHLTGNFGH
jgi:hypothetical protein